MSEENVVYSNVTFIKTKENTTVTTSAPDDSSYSEIKVTKTKNAAGPVGPQQTASNEGSKVASLKLAIGFLTVLLTGAVIGLALASYFYFQTMEQMLRLAAENRNLTEICSQEISPTVETNTCPAFLNTTKPCLNCQDGWEDKGSQCYYFSKNHSCWEEAREQCQQQGADLVQVSSREEQIFLAARVKQLMQGESDRFWIGLTDAKTEGKWLWVDGSPLDERLKFWISSEPDNWKEEDPLRGEDCACLGDRNRDEYCWYDRACSYPQRHICEKSGKAGYLLCAET